MEHARCVEIECQSAPFAGKQLKEGSCYTKLEHRFTLHVAYLQSEPYHRRTTINHTHLIDIHV